MATMEAIEGKSESSGQPLPSISALDKIIVAFAGPFFSFLLALVFAFVVMGVGRPVSEAETTTIIGYVEKDSPAEKYGLRAGDRITEVDGQPVSKFGGMGDSVMWRIVRSEGAKVEVKVVRDDKTLVFYPEPTKDPTRFWQRQSLRQIKIQPAESAVIAKILPDSPAAKAGLKVGDCVRKVNGNAFYHYAAVADYIEEHPNQGLTLRVERKGVEPFDLQVTPVTPVSPPNEKPKLGLEWDGNGKTSLAHPGAIEQIVASVNTMADTFGALFARKSDIKPQHLGGPVKIMDVYARLFNSEQGWRLALWFSVLMNVNLALLNMLPVPVLDGGHILLAIVEGIRRKPLSVRIVSAVQTTCAVLLIGFMMYLAFYDVQDLPWRHNKDKVVEPKFAPQPPARH
jgi:regulator of sigma E protease